jgi:hypothetical protein
MMEEKNPQNSNDDSKERNDDKNNSKSEESSGKHSEEVEEETIENDDSDETQVEESDIEIIDLSGEVDKYADIDLDDDEQLKDMLKDFSDIEDLSIEEMMEIQNAIDDVIEVTDKSESIAEIQVQIDSKQELLVDPYEGWGIYETIREEFKPEITDDLESLIQEELEKKRVKKKIITEEQFTQYCLEKKTKIWYHALWTLVFDIEDHQAQKGTLYEILKDVTSKSPIDPLPEHKFYFGLGFILRLSVNGKKIIEYRGDQLKLNVGIDILNDILHKVGPPISERPILTKTERKKMFMDFLTDDFKDI